ncbi:MULTISPECIES: lasso peptide biosynthesis B2 protein [unclassified Anabaena]|uniref:lasso peptide biosynthesis B2 protein n=1 Tax=unclassified Anabaena TaxID=2619674 RepID=UPI0039C5F6EE
MKRLRKFLCLSAGDRNFLIVTFFLLAAIRLGLVLIQFNQLLKLLTKISHSREPLPSTNQVSVGKIVWTVDKVTPYVPGTKCLARALTTQVLMRRYGHSGELRLGVAKAETGKLEAHAWIEYQGLVIIGNIPDLSRYIPLPSLEGVKL